MKVFTINDTTFQIEALDLVKRSGYGSYSLVVWIRDEKTTEGDELKEMTHDSELYDEYQDLSMSEQYDFLYEKCQLKIERMIEDYYSSL